MKSTGITNTTFQRKLWNMECGRRNPIRNQVDYISEKWAWKKTRGRMEGWNKYSKEIKTNININKVTCQKIGQEIWNKICKVFDEDGKKVLGVIKHRKRHQDGELQQHSKKLKKLRLDTKSVKTTRKEKWWRNRRQRLKWLRKRK